MARALVVGLLGEGATFIAVKNRWRPLVADKGEAKDKRGQRMEAY